MKAPRIYMLSLVVVALLLSGPASAGDGGKAGDADVRKVIKQFEEGLAQRDLTKIEPLMAADLVVLENGHRNDGWTDFRDNHLVPEMKDPMPPAKAEIVRVRASAAMAWAYTKTEMQVTTKNGEKRDVLMWSTFILEKRGPEWKIVLLDWSIRTLKPDSR